MKIGTNIPLPSDCFLFLLFRCHHHLLQGAMMRLVCKKGGVNSAPAISLSSSTTSSKLPLEAEAMSDCFRIAQEIWQSTGRFSWKDECAACVVMEIDNKNEHGQFTSIDICDHLVKSKLAFTHTLCLDMTKFDTWLHFNQNMDDTQVLSTLEPNHVCSIVQWHRERARETESVPKGCTSMMLMVSKVKFTQFFRMSDDFNLFTRIINDSAHQQWNGTNCLFDSLVNLRSHLMMVSHPSVILLIPMLLGKEQHFQQFEREGHGKKCPYCSKIVIPRQNSQIRAYTSL